MIAIFLFFFSFYTEIFLINFKYRFGYSRRVKNFQLFCLRNSRNSALPEAGMRGPCANPRCTRMFSVT